MLHFQLHVHNLLKEQKYYQDHPHFQIRYRKSINYNLDSPIVYIALDTSLHRIQYTCVCILTVYYTSIHKSIDYIIHYKYDYIWNVHNHKYTILNTLYILNHISNYKRNDNTRFNIYQYMVHILYDN